MTKIDFLISSYAAFFTSFHFIWITPLVSPAKMLKIRIKCSKQIFLFLIQGLQKGITQILYFNFKLNNWVIPVSIQQYDWSMQHLMLWCLRKLDIIFWSVKKYFSSYLPCLRQSAHCNVTQSHYNGEKRM